MIKVNFLKRLESSVSSFATTLKRTVANILSLEERIQRFQSFRDANADLDLASFSSDDIEDEELRDALQVGKGLVYKMAHLDVNLWLRDLKQDRGQLEYLAKEAEEVNATRDAKLAHLRNLIGMKVCNPTTNRQGISNRKVLVFTAFSDTAEYLYRQLAPWASSELKVNIALVSGGPRGCQTTFGKADFNSILVNFSPRAKKRDKMRSLPQTDEIDILIATDCISEGQNLQDCDYLVNYDIHWNPVRIIQRFGRIDRIGSINPAVQLVNFWPTQDLNKYINLKNRVEARMALVDIAATQEDNILNTDELKDLIQEDLKYRDKQLLRLKDEILDLEDFNETVTLSEFTLDDFRLELTKYIEANKQLLEDAPLGLYAVVPTEPKSRPIQPGVIYCLRQTGDSTGNEQVNPLQPYFLAYVWDEGTVRYTFAQPKQILEVFRLLCINRKAAITALCDAFDAETKDGLDMSRYNELLRKAVLGFEATFRKRSAASLLSGRNGVLNFASRQVSDATDFELISWLVIR